MRIRTAAVLCILAAVAACDSASEGVVGPDLGRQAASNGSGAGAQAVTGSGHYVNSNGAWRTFSFHIRRKSDGGVSGSFQLVGHQQPSIRFHGPLTCLSVVGNEAWIGGIYEKSTNSNLIGTGFGFYVKDNGQGANAQPDLLRRHVRGQVPEDWCVAMPDVSGSEYLFPIESGNIKIHSR